VIVALYLITTTEDDILLISQNSSGIFKFVQRVIASAAQTADRLRVRAADQKQPRSKGAQLSPNKNARQRVVKPIDPAF
jgi:hypothetical protein